MSVNTAGKLSDELQNQAINLVQKERDTHKDATVFVTDKVAFQMRNLLKSLRKNYWGIFDNPKDPVTGQDRIWVPLTQSVCNAVIKSIDLDTKDVNMRAKNSEAVGKAVIVRGITKNTLDNMFFGEDLDDLAQTLSIDGTVVWKTWKGEKEDIDGNNIRLKQVDFLNIFMDMTSDSIQKAYRFTERGLLTPEEGEGMDGWVNNKDLEGTISLSPTDLDLNSTTSETTTKLRDFWETWGQIPKSFITGDAKDKEMVEGHIVVSGIDTNDGKLHLVEENESGLKPYEEVRYMKVEGRWAGLGPAEMVFWMQLWINIIVNIRITRSKIAQLGLFKIKKGTGITPQMLSRLPVNGAIKVSNMDDIQQFIMKEASEASYNDEKVADNWAQRITSAFDVVTGEQLPSSTPATNALIQNRNAFSAFDKVKENIGLFLQRWLKRHAMPIIKSSFNKDELITILGDGDELRQYAKWIANKMVAGQLKDRLDEEKPVPNPEQITNEVQRLTEKMLSQGDMFVKLIKDYVFDDSKMDVMVDVTNESFDKAVLANNLVSALQVAPEYRDLIVRQIFDLMGLSVPIESEKRAEETQAQDRQANGPGTPGGPAGPGIPGGPGQRFTTTPTQPVANASQL